LPIQDARLPCCGLIAEKVRGFWEPHEPGRRCDTGPAETCQDGLHIFPDGGGSCICGNDFLNVAPPPQPSPIWYLEP
jgi:hypothetical protein